MQPMSGHGGNREDCQPHGDEAATSFVMPWMVSFRDEVPRVTQLSFHSTLGPAKSQPNIHITKEVWERIRPYAVSIPIPLQSELSKLMCTTIT
ncbi:hypothetical protein U9M48_012134 [Paspalum notatum var. saurae]|uniref:Uncharacterized protein n=1 Tax=Paspalum notatum var. saurae TaxID=547442 RepID=A0AAQ3WHR4_PASNO